MKPNAEQSDREFAYTVACKRMMNDCALMQDEVDTAKRAATQGISRGAMIRVEIELIPTVLGPTGPGLPICQALTR
jgi:hypothetical protein